MYMNQIRPLFYDFLHVIVFLRFNPPLLPLCFYSISFWSNFSFLWSISNPLIKGALSRLGQFLPTKSPLKKMKNAFCFILKALFIFEIFQFLFKIFGSVGKWYGKFQTLWPYKLDNKQLQYTYCQISQEVKAIRQWNRNILLKTHE